MLKMNACEAKLRKEAEVFDILNDLYPALSVSGNIFRTSIIGSLGNFSIAAFCSWEIKVAGLKWDLPDQNSYQITDL